MTKYLAIFLIILLLIPLYGCADRAAPSCRDILQSLTDCEIGLPAGRVYSLTAVEGEEEYISPTLLAALFSAPAQTVKGWIDGAFFLPSHADPCEFAVILCDSPATVSDTARLLSARLTAIRKLKNTDEHRAILEEAKVLVKGNYVFLIISRDTENALALLK